MSSSFTTYFKSFLSDEGICVKWGKGILFWNLNGFLSLGLD